MKRIGFLAFLLLFIVGCIALTELVGCTVPTNATSQQVIDAKTGNQLIAAGARLSFNVLVADINAQKVKGRISADKFAEIVALEDQVAPLLDKLDAAAAGDPNQFAQVVRDEVKQRALLIAAYEAARLVQ